MKFQITKHTQEQFTIEGDNAKEAMDKAKSGEANSSGYVENYTCREVVTKPVTLAPTGQA